MTRALLILTLLSGCAAVHCQPVKDRDTGKLVLTACSARTGPPLIGEMHPFVYYPKQTPWTIIPENANQSGLSELGSPVGAAISHFQWGVGGP